MRKLKIAVSVKETELNDQIISILKETFHYIEIENKEFDIDAILEDQNSEGYDLLFLDIDFVPDDFDKEYDNFLFRSLKVVALSSKEENALRAYNFGALDFIPKPISYECLLLGIKRVRNLWDILNFNSDFKNTISNGAPLRILAVHSLTEVKIIPVDTIVYLQSQGRYTLIYTSDGESIVSSKNLGVYEELLSRNNFFRIHHSYIVNVELSLKVHKKDGMYLQIGDNKYLPISKRRVDSFYRHLGIIA